MDLKKQFEDETGQQAYIDNDLRPTIPKDYYVEWLENKVNNANKRCNDCPAFGETKLWCCNNCGKRVEEF